jgi:hypothetical protein
MTSLSHHALLATLHETVPPALFSADALAGVRALLATLPGAPVEVTLLECHLGESLTVDLALGLNRHGFACFPFTPVTASNPTWARISALARATGAMDKLTRVWLEFDDIDQAWDRPPTPAVIVGIDGFPDACRSDADLTLLLDRVLEPLAGEPLDPGTRAIVRRCFARLPPAPAHIGDVGVYLSRGGAPIRLCVANLGDEEILTYLGEIGWQGKRDILARSLADTAHARADSPFPSYLLHIDVRDGVGSRVGLELMLDRRIQFAGALAEQALLAQLVERGLCSPDKRAALERWPGYTESEGRLCIRRVNSVKISCSGEGRLDAKAYLVVLHVAAASALA